MGNKNRNRIHPVAAAIASEIVEGVSTATPEVVVEAKPAKPVKPLADRGRGKPVEGVSTATPEVVVEAKPAKPVKPLADRGRGKPTAKKVVNPQPTLELKKSAVRKAGGTMEYVNRQWQIEVSEKKHTFASRRMAELTVGDLCKEVGVEVPA